MNHLGIPINPRVNQLDASLLDSELIDQLKVKVLDAFKFWKPDIKDSYEPELMLALKALLFKVTVWDHATTYGAKLQNLMLVKSSNRKPIGPKGKALYGIITVLGPYLWMKLKDKQLLGTRTQDTASLIWNTATLFNFVAFIFSGNYLTFVMRIIGARFASVTKSTMRNVNYEFQNRQLIWNALTEFLLFALPLVNYRKLIRKFTKLHRPPPSASSDANDGPLHFLPMKTCAICYEQDSTVAAKGVTNPYVAGCLHPYCYVCLTLRLTEDPEWQCLKCNQQLSSKELKPF